MALLSTAPRGPRLRTRGIAGMSSHVHGLFVSEAAALAAMTDLETTAGIKRDHIALIANQVPRPDDLNHQKVRDAAIDAAPDDELPGVGTAAGVGAAAGATVGILGSVGALGLMAVPVIGPIVATGWIASLVLGAAAGTAVGGIVGVLSEAGVSGEDSAFYNDAIHRGMAMLTVRCDETDVPAVEAVMARHGATGPGTGTGAAGVVLPVGSGLAVA
jgi:hypothetical protein